MASLAGYSRYRDPLNILIHETEEQYESAKNNDPDYKNNHLLANKKELEITGKQESNLRDAFDYMERNYPGFLNRTGFITRFDYVDGNGNYIESRQATHFNGLFYGAHTFNKNSPTEIEEEKKFKTSQISY